MLAPFAIDMYLPALPTIATALGTGIDEMEATVAILLFGYALGQLLLGPVSDAVGRRPVLLGGLVTYMLASVLAGAAQSIEQLYLFRFLQALGGAGSVVVFPLVRDRFNDEDGARIISYVMALTVVAPLIAPIIGGYVLAISSWSAIFFLLAGLGALTLLAAAIVIKPAGSKRKRFSPGVVLAGYRTVLGQWRILSFILAGSFAFAALFAFVAGSPFVYITYFGVSPQNYGYLVGLNAAAMIGANLINAQLLSHIDPIRKTLVGATLLAIAGGALFAFAQLGLGIGWIVAAVVGVVGALGLTATNAIVGALSVLPEENGTVSALNGAAQFAVGALSSLIVSLVASTDPVPMAAIMMGCGFLAFLAALPLQIFAQSKTGESHA